MVSPNENGRDAVTDLKLELVAEGFEFPEGPIAMDDGSVILTEIKAQRLTRVTPDGKISTVAGTGTAGQSGDGGPATAATMRNPRGVAVDPNGTVIFSDSQMSITENVSNAGTTASGEIRAFRP